MSSFLENDIDECVPGTVKHNDMNTSIRKKSPNVARAMYVSQKEEQEKEQKTDTFDSLESCNINESSQHLNPQKYAFNVILPKKGMSHYQTNKNSSREETKNCSS